MRDAVELLLYLVVPPHPPPHQLQKNRLAWRLATGVISQLSESRTRRREWRSRKVPAPISSAAPGSSLPLPVLLEALSPSCDLFRRPRKTPTTSSLALSVLAFSCAPSTTQRALVTGGQTATMPHSRPDRTSCCALTFRAPQGPCGATPA